MMGWFCQILKKLWTVKMRTLP